MSAFPMAVHAAGLVWLSGHAALDLATGEILGSTVEEQADQIFAGLAKTLAGHGAHLSDLLRVECFLADLSFYPDWNAAFVRHFPVSPPARTTLIALPPIPGLLLEIQGIALSDRER
ncbi:MAG: Endoribonuclease [Actinomycetia bacterium]|jgi:2-iminobutanoate/2-iminopropanoate deaminase|nr:Endoribonuclease [Actinomycetes bacterium]